MKLNNLMSSFLMVFACGLVMFILISIGAVMGGMSGEFKKDVPKPSVLVIDLEGLIVDGKVFLQDLREYAGNKNIKGVLVRINSPGGVVGASQEIYTELKRVREELQKPVVASAQSMAASGAYYAALGAEKIVTNPGTLLGSIGVIIQFANLEKLYNWAKIEKYVVKTGRYKDSGSDHRPMTENEKEYFQKLIDNVQEQFEDAVVKNRKLAAYIVEKYADGRVFTGEDAVKLGFADQVGTAEDALRIVGEMSGLGEEPEVFEPPKRRDEFWEALARLFVPQRIDAAIKEALPLKLLGQPLYVMPGTAGL